MPTSKPKRKQTVAMAKKLGAASARHHTPGHARGSKQDNLQKLLFGKAAARELIGATKQNALAKKKRKKKKK